MTLIKTSLLNGIAVGVRMFTALILNKILAVYVGPSGYAVIGQFQNAVSMIVSFATGAINTGVIKYTAEYYDDTPRQRALWCTAGSIVLIGSIIASLALFLFRESLAVYFLKAAKFSSIFLWLSGTIIMFSFNALMLAILNGKKEVQRYVTINITGSAIALVLTGFLAWQWGLYGALVALSINQSIVFFVTLYICRKADWFSLRNLVGRIDPSIARNLGKFVMMAGTSAVVVPTSHIFIRNHLGAQFGWNYAGYWDAMWKISTINLTLVTTTLSLYYLPRIAEIREWIELKNEILRGYIIILPIVVISAITLFLGKDYLVQLLFTPDFLPMRELFAWQLPGDVIKIASWLLGYVLVGRAMAFPFLITEVAFAGSFCILTVVFTAFTGFSGVALAYFVNYLLHFTVMAIIVLNKKLG